MDAEEQNQITRDIASHCGNNTEAANIALKLLASPTKVHIWDEKDINNGNIIYYRFSNTYILSRFMGHFKDLHIPLSLFLYLCQRNNIDIPQEDRVSVVRVREAITRFREAQQQQEQRPQRPWNVNENQILEGDTIHVSSDNNEMSQLGFTSPVDGGNNDYSDSEMDTEINNDETQDEDHPAIRASMAGLLNASPEFSDNGEVEEYIRRINGDGTVPTPPQTASKLPPPMKSIPKPTKTVDDDIGDTTKDNVDDDGDNLKQPPEELNHLPPLPPPLPNDNNVAAAGGTTMAVSAPILPPTVAQQQTANPIGGVDNNPNNYTTPHAKSNNITQSTMVRSQSINNNNSLGMQSPFVPTATGGMSLEDNNDSVQENKDRKPPAIDQSFLEQHDGKLHGQTMADKLRVLGQNIKPVQYAEKRPSKDDLKKEYGEIEDIVRKRCINLQAQEVFTKVQELYTYQDDRRAPEQGNVAYALKNLETNQVQYFREGMLDAYVAIIQQVMTLLMEGTQVGYRELWYIVEDMFMIALTDEEEEPMGDGSNDNDDDDDDVKDFLLELDGEQLSDYDKKVKARAFTEYTNAVNALCTLLGVTHMHLNICKGTRACGFGPLVLMRKGETVLQPIWSTGNTGAGIPPGWVTEQIDRPTEVIDFSREEGAPLDWSLGKDNLRIDSVKEHFLPTKANAWPSIVHFFEASGPCGWYVNSGCALDNNVVCILTRGRLTFYAAYFGVYAERNLGIPIMFTSKLLYYSYVVLYEV